MATDSETDGVVGLLALTEKLGVVESTLEQERTGGSRYDDTTDEEGNPTPISKQVARVTRADGLEDALDGIDAGES